MTAPNESAIEEVSLEWLSGMGYAVLHGPDIAPEEPSAERQAFSDVVLVDRLRSAIASLNPDLPSEALEDAFRKVTRPDSPSLEANNRAFHRMLVDGVPIEYKRKDGSAAGGSARLIDFENPENNDWLAVNQFTVIENNHNRRPDIVVFINGLPIGVVELKNPADEDATIRNAFNQLQTYKAEIPSLFTFNELLVISDGNDARIGSLTAGWEWFLPWRTVDGTETAEVGLPELEVLVKGVFDKERLLRYLEGFVVYDEGQDGSLVKKIAGYHQFHAVQKAVETTVQAASPEGDRRCGVVWHTQGSGKSLTMVFYAGRLILDENLKNPTVVVLTDRNDLDDQLFGTFSRCNEILRQQPVQAESRDKLRELLKVASGGVIFTTIQKFFPEEGGKHPQLSDRENIVVIADEAHRSQYDFIDGFARHMRDALPNASFIGFTGTPVELTDKNTQAVFGNHISVYDIEQAVKDKATVPIYYEGRMARLDLDEAEKPLLDPEFEEVTEGEEFERKEKLKTKWAALEALAGAEKRVKLIAADLVEHFERRCEALSGKAMIVCMSRRICVEMYKAITELRPEWHDEADEKGAIKVVMTGSASDPVDWQPHIHGKKVREDLALRFKDPKDPLKVVLVRDMWLTGFDAPCLHTMYVDKPMRGHGLMQAIARVNRVFHDKPGGLIVDYIGLGDQLKKALANYTENGGRGKTALNQAEAVAVMLEKYEICRDMMHGFDWSSWTGGDKQAQLRLLASARQHVLEQPQGQERFLPAVTDLSKAFALAVPHEETFKVRDDVAFFQAVRSGLAKLREQGERPEEDLDHAVQQLVSKAITSDEVVDIFQAAGLDKPNISILSDEFLAEVQGMPHRNLAVELLQKLLRDEIRRCSRRNLVQGRSFKEMLEKSLLAYRNRSIATAKIIEELIDLAKDMRDAAGRGEKLGLSEDEVAFYDALEVNDSAVKVLGDDALRDIARELVDSVRRNVTIDWTVRESVRAKLRTLVKRILRRYGYPPDKQEKATRVVLEQAELLCKDWAA